MPRLLLAAITLLALAGCESVSYEYTPPASEQGRFCVTQCAAIRETCRGNEIHRAELKKNACEHTQDIKLRACLAKATNKDQEAACDKERRRNSCWESESTYRCDEDYQSCYVNCGGVIITHKE